MAVDYPSFRMVVHNFTPVEVDLFLDDQELVGGSTSPINVSRGRWPSDRPLDVYWDGAVAGTQHIHVEVVDSLGRRGASAPVVYTFVVPDSQPLIVVRGFSVLEIGDSTGWMYAPQLLLADTAAGNGLRIVGFEMLDIPGLGGPFPRLWAVGISMPPGQDTPLFPPSYGDWPVEYFGKGGPRATGDTARARLTYRDSLGRLYARTVEGPIVPGALPTTFGSGYGYCKGWEDGLKVSDQCPLTSPRHLKP
jgi:hypothetical protein